MQQAERELRDIIKRWYRNGMHLFEVAEGVEKFVRSTLKELRFLPIDVEKIAEELQIDIFYEDLNEYMSRDVVSKRIGQYALCEWNNQEKERKIYIDAQASTNPGTRRIAIAHCIMFYFMVGDDDDHFMDYSQVDMARTSFVPLISEILALLMVLPVSLFCETMQNFLMKRREAGKVPIPTEEWIRFLSEKAVISEYYAAIAYRQLQQIIVANTLYHSKDI